MEPSNSEGRKRPVLAIGSRSVVLAWGSGLVAKVPKDGVPSDWIRHESHITEAVWRLGVPTHEPFGLEHHAGTELSIYARIDGPTMWASILGGTDPTNPTASASGHGRHLARLHADILAVTPPITLPRQADRLRCKLRRAGARFDLDTGPGLAALMASVPPSTAGLRLCHGDFHPGNVILSPGGPVTIDWFDAARGHPVCDIARTSLLLGAGLDDTSHVQHLPGHHPALLRLVHDAYLDEVCGLLGLDPEAVVRWRRIEAAARLAEGVAPGALIDLWRTGDRGR